MRDAFPDLPPMTVPETETVAAPWCPACGERRACIVHRPCGRPLTWACRCEPPEAAAVRAWLAWGLHLCDAEKKGADDGQGESEENKETFPREGGRQEVNGEGRGARPSAPRKSKETEEHHATKV